MTSYEVASTICQSLRFGLRLRGHRGGLGRILAGRTSTIDPCLISHSVPVHTSLILLPGLHSSTFRRDVSTFCGSRRVVDWRVLVT